MVCHHHLKSKSVNSYEEEEAAAAAGRRMSSSSPPSSPRSSFRELDTEFLTRQAKIWIEKVLDKRYDDEKTVADLLADGEILFEISKLIGNLMQKKYRAGIDSPLSLEATAFGKQSGKYVPYSHVDAFLKICKKLGLTGVDLFSPPDAVEKRDVRRVCLCIRALSNKARSQHLDLPDFDIVTHCAFMPTDMVEGMQKYLEQIWYSMSNEDSGPGLEGSRKASRNLRSSEIWWDCVESNEPICTGTFEVLSQEPDNAESKLERAFSEIGCANIGSFSVSLRSPPLKINGWSSQRSTPIKDTLTEVNTPLTLVNDNYQKVNEVSRSMDTFISDAVTRNLEKSYSLHMKKSLEVYGQLFPKDVKEEHSEDPVIHTVNGHLGNSVPSKFDEHFVSSCHKDLIDTSGLLHSELSFSDFKKDSDHVQNVKDIKANGMHVVYTPNESLPKTNSNMQINIPSKTALSMDYGVHYPNKNDPEECAHSSSVSVSHGIKKGTDDLEVKSTNMTEAKTVEVVPTKGIKLDNFNASPESTLKGDHAEFYSKSASGVTSSNIISEILLNSYHIDNHNINIPKMEHLNVEYANDMVNLDVPKTDGVDAGCMTTESSLVTINALSTPVLMNKDADKGDGNAASLSFSHRIAQGAADSAEVYINVLKKEEVEVGPINKLKLTLNYAGKEDSMFNDFRIAPPVLTVDVDQCVNKAKSDVVCEVIPEEDYADIVNTRGPEVDNMKNNNTVVTKETVVNAIRGLEEDNVLKSEVVNVESTANSRRGYSSYAIATQQDSAVDAGNLLEAENDDDSKKFPKSKAVDIDSAAGRKIGYTNDLVVPEVDPVFYAVDGLEADKIDIDSINVLKSNFNNAVSASKKSNSMMSRVLSEEDSFVNSVGHNGLKIDNVYHDYTNAVKSDDIHVDAVVNKKTENMNFVAVALEDSVVIAGNGLVADNVDDSNKNVLKSENIAAADYATDIDVVDTNYVVDSAVKMKTEYKNYAVVTEKDSVISVDSGLEADTFDNSMHLLKPEVIGGDSATNTKTRDINCAVVTDEDCVSNAGNGIEIANIHERSMEVQSLEMIGVDSAVNIETRDTDSPIVYEADSVVNMGNVLETSNINNCVLDTNIFEAISPSKAETRDIKFAVMTEKDNIVNQGNGFKPDNVNSDFKSKLISKTVDAESAMNMNGVYREEYSVANVGHGLEAETIENECKSMSNIESVNILSSKNRKIGNDLRDILANLPDEISINTDRSDVPRGDDTDTDNFSIRRFKPCQAADGNDALIADVVESQLHALAISEHGNDNEENSNKIDITTPKRDESEGKIVTKLNKKKIWVSVAACGIAVIGTAMMYIRRQNRKSEECEIKEGDTLAGISKKVGKSNCKELVLINPQIRDPDLIYPGHRLTLK